jgi:hypothetical protein
MRIPCRNVQSRDNLAGGKRYAPCQPHARTERKPETLTSVKTTTKPALINIAAVESRSRIDMVRRRSTVRFRNGAPVQEANSNGPNLLGSHSGSQVVRISDDTDDTGDVSASPPLDVPNIRLSLAIAPAQGTCRTPRWPRLQVGNEIAVSTGTQRRSLPAE